MSTLQAYFEGRRELFKGLYIYNVEKEWLKHPVIHLDMSNDKYYSMKNTISTIDLLLEIEEKRFGLKTDKEEKEDFNKRLTRIIMSAHEQTGREVVVLIDEYDAPMLDSIPRS